MIDLLAAAIADNPPAVVRAADPRAVPAVSCACGDGCPCGPAKVHKQAADITKLIDENKSLKARIAEAPAVPVVTPPVPDEPPPGFRPGRVWITNEGRYGWGRVVGGYFAPAYGDDPALFDSGPEPRFARPARAAAPAAAPAPACYTDRRGRRVCPR